MSVKAINDQIEADALKPISASIDGQSVQKRSADDLIKLRDAAAAAEAAAANRPGLGLRFQKITPVYQ